MIPVVHQGPLQNSAKWLQNAWVSVQREGQSAAAVTVQRYHAQFAALPMQVVRLQQRVQRGYESMDLEHKREVLAELWRVRSSLNLLALVSPDSLQQLAGIDAKTLVGLQAAVSQIAVSLPR